MALLTSLDLTIARRAAYLGPVPKDAKGRKTSTSP